MYTGAMRWPGVLAACGAIAGCIDKSNSGPFDGMPLDGVFAVGVSAPVHVARDSDGLAHIDARTLADAAFVQGFVMAHDRLPQLDILRRYAEGTLAELYGALDPRVIDDDLAIRGYRLRPLAEQAFAMLQASGEPDDQQVVALLERFAAGVNAYALQLKQGTWTLDPALATSFNPALFVAWSPVDSLALGRFQALAMSRSAPFELDITELYQKLRATYDLATGAPPSAAARRGLSRDLLRFAPIGREPAIDGFPNVASDGGTRSDGSTAAVGGAAGPARPVVPQALLDAARGGLSGPDHDGPLGALGPHAWFHPVTGSVAWAVGPALTGGARALLVSEQHTALSNPSVFYPTHLIVAHVDERDPSRDAALDLLGVTLPGIPGVLYGTNGHVAWAGIASEHDTSDVYLEQLVRCGNGDCALWTDPQGTPRQVPVLSSTESFKIGALGELTGSQVATYELVPHHGPILPAIDHATHTLIPRTGSTALSLRTTGDQPTFELLALYRLAKATTVAQGFQAFHGIAYAGAESFTMIDDSLALGWTAHDELPVRKPGAYGWDPLTNQDGLAPFFVLPGDGDGDWLAGRTLSSRFVPHAVDPAPGYLVAGNADPVGATFDGLPLNQGVAAGDPLYVGVDYDAGLREAQVAAALVQRSAGHALTLDDMAAITLDSSSSLGAQLAPPLRAALARLDDTQPAPPTDLAPYLAGLGAADRARLATARTLIAGWTFATPAALDAPDPDSAATAVFHTWLRCFIARALSDELDVIGFEVWRLTDDQLARIVHALLTDPRSFVTSPSTQQPIVCDSYAAAGPDDSCTKVILQAMVDAMAELESPRGFATADTAAWRWGKLHRLGLGALTPGLNLPGPGDPDPAGFAISGDSFVADPGDPAARALVPSRAAGGPALHLLAEAAPGTGVRLRWSLPGGVIFDSRSPHYRDLLDRAYRADSVLAVPYTIDEIVAAGESRWVFR